MRRSYILHQGKGAKLSKMVCVHYPVTGRHAGIAHWYSLSTPICCDTLFLSYFFGQTRACISLYYKLVTWLDLFDLC